MSEVVEETVRIAAPPKIVWCYWTDPVRLGAWWGAGAEVDARPGGDYVVEMGGGPVMRGAFVELVPHERIVFTFGWEPTDGAAPGPPLQVRLEARGRPAARTAELAANTDAPHLEALAAAGTAGCTRLLQPLP